ncbi:MAG TPA: 30S ribosomal protein S12 methylthiotransferase RimO [Flavobacteriales bacterium]|nr:30S ribosomal protein S12 methylthiotransferase RimO [Flavobacteriales bacterium]HMW97053.1 30S ribosomal protein S12 methylthiotransferase RimO [Flavobacteriales bacterium]HNA32740.1 30S ribosomal protein S12 methylthiotransferase RimO [Flavobacteriales bacterium]HNE81147.1 30S ribosomal protein S12 methylthiotransferase RimO [Flavobacteriales bacterium]HNI04596.1 30S ribosomal protein S12 methylthiotransferase RimO [Flavobacteriales bacterium]
MKARTLKRTKVNVITLGCSKNTVDSEVLMAQLKANGIAVDHEAAHDDHSVVVINTCGFIENAKQESIDTILSWARAKDKGQVEKVYVTGCLSQRYAPELKEGIPQVDAWFGTRDLPRLLKTLKADYKHELVGERLLTTPAHFAYFKISEGCDRKCSFCAIPLMRGGHVSVPMEQLVTNARGLAARGVKELILIAQDLTYYGLDIYKKRNLDELVSRLSDVEGIDWIRLHYAFPSGFPMDVLDVMRDRPNVCNYLDMPLQHGSTRMLTRMRRGITQEKTEKLVSDIRSRVPGIAIRTTLIAGFPGETEADHEDSLRWIERMRFDRLGCFTYSHEEDTHAFGMEDDVPFGVKQERANAIMELQGGISFELNQRKVGQEYRVLVDKAESGNYHARTEHDSPEVDNDVLIATSSGHLRLGDFAQVRITEAREHELVAVPV